MRRRNFLALSGLGLGNSLLGCTTWTGFSSTGPEEDAGSDIFLQLVAQNDTGIPKLLARQQRAPSHPFVGGIVGGHGLYHAGAASGLIHRFAAAYATPQSRYAGDPELLDAMARATRFLLRRQHSDGTIDLITTNFHSTPDTGFVLEWVCAAAGVLETATASDRSPAATTARISLVADLRTFIRRGADALAIGGIHTPNHRWVVCMALARANALAPDPRYVARIDEWLAEGIDIDADGQFTERSSTVYSPLTDRCLITVSQLLDRPDLLDPVRRNLAMTLYYIHADGEVVTAASRRQDRYRRGSPAPYYFAYRFMAQHDRDRRFAAMARFIEATSIESLTGNLIRFLESPALQAAMPADAPLPSDYEKFFRHSSLVRIRRDRVSATILADNPTFFSLHHGSAALALRFASAFFGKGQFVGHALHKAGNTWIMHQDLEGPYYQPIAPVHRRADGDWEQMPRTLRPTSEVQRLRSVVRITETGSAGFDVEIEITGTTAVPVAIELGLRRGGVCSGTTALAATPTDGRARETRLLTHGTGRYRLGTDTIEFTAGPEENQDENQAAHGAEHEWTQLRGALPKLDGPSVYVTGFTPLRRTLRFR